MDYGSVLLLEMKTRESRAQSFPSAGTCIQVSDSNSHSCHGSEMICQPRTTLCIRDLKNFCRDWLLLNLILLLDILLLHKEKSCLDIRVGTSLSSNCYKALVRPAETPSLRAQLLCTRNLLCKEKHPSLCQKSSPDGKRQRRLLSHIPSVLFLSQNDMHRIGRTLHQSRLPKQHPAPCAAVCCGKLHIRRLRRYLS